MTGKWLRWLLASAMVLSLAGCGAKEGTGTGEESSVAVSEAETPASEAKEAGAEDKTAPIHYEADVVIIGAGGAGMSAAVAAKDAGAGVVVLEKESYAGGNTTRATGGMNASETKFQEAQGIKDSNELFAKETIEGGKGTNDKALVEFMANHSSAAIDWLDSLGMPLSNVTFSGGFSVERIHRPKDGSAVGSFLVDHFVQNLKERNVPILYNTRATALQMADGRVSGVQAVDSNGQHYEIQAKAVIVTTGGFGANMEMVEKYQPQLKGFVTTNVPGATGDGIQLLEAVGAAVVDMDQIQIHPTVEQSTSDLITEALRGQGAILVNTEGKRFTNELLTRDVVSQAELAQPGSSVYILFDQKVRDNNKAVEKYINKGYTLEGESLAALAEKMGVDAATLEATIQTYNEGVNAGKDAEFGRETGLELVDSPNFYAIKVAPGVHHTMGGVKINTETEVLNEKGESIPGLYAAGEVTGGVHGSNRIGGNAVCDIVVFGKEAGEQAVNYVKANGGVGSMTVPMEPAGSAPEAVQPKEGVEAQYKDGVYQETVKGHNAELTVQVEVKDGYVTAITFPKNEETSAIFAGVENTLVPNIIREQSAEVETVSGATVSSNAVKEAVAKILEANKK